MLNRYNTVSFLVACLVALSASAQVPAPEVIAAAYARCDEAKTAVAKAYCKLLVDFKVSEARQKAGQEGLERQLAEQKAQLEGMAAELERSRTALDPNEYDEADSDPAPRARPNGRETSQELIARRLKEIRHRRAGRPAPVPRPERPRPPVEPPPRVEVQRPPPPVAVAPAPVVVAPVPRPLGPGGAPYSISPIQPTNIAMTSEIERVPRLALQGLGAAVNEWMQGAETRLIIRKNGVPLSIVSEGDIPMEYAYATVGRGRTTRHVVVDPAAYDTVYVPYVKPTDRIEVVVLVQTGNHINVPGLPPQFLWVERKKVRLPRIPQFGRFLMDVNGLIVF
ncbi:MAG: hypothetical protein AAB403_14200 [Planctomycetota bacterium]